MDFDPLYKRITEKLNTALLVNDIIGEGEKGGQVLNECLSEEGVMIVPIFKIFFF